MEGAWRVSEQGNRQQTYGLWNGVRLGRTAVAACHTAKEETNQLKNGRAKPKHHTDIDVNKV